MSPAAAAPAPGTDTEPAGLPPGDKVPAGPPVSAPGPDTSEAASFAEWRTLVSDSFVPLEATPVHPGIPRFAGRLTGRRLRELAIVQIDAMAHRVERTPGLISGGGEGFYKLSLQMSGCGVLVQGGREAVLEAGDLAIYDTGQPYTLSFEEDFTTLVLMFPKQLLGLSAEDMAELTAVRLGGGHRLGRAVVPFLTQIAGMLPDLDGPIGHRLALNTVDLLSTLLADEAYARPGADSGGHERLLRRVQHFIDGQLANPELSPGYIAAAHFMSTRSLHKLFEDSGTTVAAWIRGRRLEGARRDLADPLQADIPVGAIGTRWGLPDPAHFSRVFRAAYGLSPSAYRLRR
ncbi:helix-turn-helix domain-containing protein [Arthrobacter luteolus]|uniref:AraC-like ligand-binding domain-containing protein n=1 Tax=Arthrobacter luteolus TaxID=98672 RepID=UPI0009F9B6DD|nr:helix-turn-helix domain-containing protein [Arthrobacter luteolus]